MRGANTPLIEAKIPTDDHLSAVRICQPPEKSVEDRLKGIEETILLILEEIRILKE